MSWRCSHCYCYWWHTHINNHDNDLDDAYDDGCYDEEHAMMLSWWRWWAAAVATSKSWPKSENISKYTASKKKDPKIPTSLRHSYTHENEPSSSGAPSKADLKMTAKRLWLQAFSSRRRQDGKKGSLRKSKARNQEKQKLQKDPQTRMF